MKKIPQLLCASVLTCSIYAMSLPDALACGPSFIQPIFAMTSRPEQVEQFAKGNVGIIHPTFYRSALFAAYRGFNNLPFSEKEQQDLVRNWLAEYENTDNNETIKNTAIDNWNAARKKLAKDATPISTDRNNPDSYSAFMNCTVGAFDNASKTLTARVEKYATDSVHLKEWLHGQDQVFGNCAESKEIPSPVAADAPDWLKADRDYQIAAAYFYATQYDEANSRFEKIAQNTASPWHEIAAYLLARVSIRQASAISEDDKQHDKMLAYYQQAEQQLKRVLADSQLSNVHAAAQQLLNYVQFRHHPDALLTQLAKKLTDKRENATLFQDVTDYRRLLDKAAPSIYEAVTAEQKTLNTQFRHNNELTDWIFTVQSIDSETDKTLLKSAYQHAVQRWQATKNTAWLVASLMKASSDNTEVQALIAAAKTLDKTSSAFLSANYHAIRLQIALGQRDEARKALDGLLNDGSLAMNKSAKNQFLAQRLQLAQDLNEFVKYAQRHAVQFAYDNSEVLLVDVSTPAKDGEDYTKNERAWSKRTLFDVDAVHIMNSQLPLAVLTKLALHPELPAYLRSHVALSAYVRAILLQDDKTAGQLAPELGQLIPELKPFMAAYNKAKAGNAQTYEAVWAMLKNPAMRPLVDQGTGRQANFSDIENYRDNWWCLNLTETANTQPPTFLTTEQIALANTENAKIKQLASSGSNFLATKTAQWATAAPKEKRLPEALALAVKATRYGCQNCETGKVSKAAFDLLKDHFGASDWKKKTPYWFKDEGCETK